MSMNRAACCFIVFSRCGSHTPSIKILFLYLDLSLTFDGVVKVHLFRSESWLQCRTSGCRVFLELSILGCNGRPIELPEVLQSNFPWLDRVSF